MKIKISVPKEFEDEYKKTKFKETFERVLADIDWSMKNDKILLVGNYEYETLKMLGEAFSNSKEEK